MLHHPERTSFLYKKKEHKNLEAQYMYVYSQGCLQLRMILYELQTYVLDTVVCYNWVFSCTLRP